MNKINKLWDKAVNGKLKDEDMKTHSLEQEKKDILKILSEEETEQ